MMKIGRNRNAYTRMAQIFSSAAFDRIDAVGA